MDSSEEAPFKKGSGLLEVRDQGKEINKGSKSQNVLAHKKG